MDGALNAAHGSTYRKYVVCAITLDPEEPPAALVRMVCYSHHQYPQMSQSRKELHLTRFGAFEVDVRSGELRKGGLKLKLQGMPFQILEALLERPGDVVTREELRLRIWPEGTFVDFDNSLNSAVNRLREALDDSADNPRFVETLPRRGYRFIAPVERIGEASPQPAKERTTATLPGVSGFRRWYQGLAGVALIAIMLGFAYYLGKLGPQSVPPADAKLMLAVLPFKNLASEPEQDYFSDGLTEEMIAHLGRLNPERLGIIASTSAMRYKSTDKSIAQIGDELGVSYILEGSVRRESDRVRITAQLIHVGDQTHLWAETYEHDLAGVLAIQQEVANRIAKSLTVQLLPDRAPFLSSRSPGSAAYDAYLKGRYHWNKRTARASKEAIKYFQQAIDEDPNFAPAYAGLAVSYNYLAGFAPPQDVYPKAKQAALKALEIDDTLAEAHAALGMIKLSFDLDWAGAEKEFEQALELNPNLAIAHLWYGCYLSAREKHDAAIAAAQSAQNLDPLSFAVNADAGWYYLFARRYDNAIQQCRRTLELEPSFSPARFCLELAYMQKGMYKESLAQAQALLISYGASKEQAAALADADPETGLKRAWEWQLRGLYNASQQGQHISPYQFAWHYVVLGQDDQALDSLEKAYGERDPFLVYLKGDPMFDPLRSDARFQDIVRRMNFPK